MPKGAIPRLCAGTTRPIATDELLHFLELVVVALFKPLGNVLESTRLVTRNNRIFVDARPRASLPKECAQPVVQFPAGRPQQQQFLNEGTGRKVNLHVGVDDRLMASNF